MNPNLVADATVEARRFLARVKPRILRTDTGRSITTSDLADSLVRRAEVEQAVIPGKRPETVLCVECKCVLAVPKNGGKVPTKCAACAGKLCSSCGRMLAQGKSGKLCGPCVKERSRSRLTCPACKGPKRSRVSEVCGPCAKARRAKKPPEMRACADCPTLVSSTARSGRCRSCACKRREATKTPEQKAVVAEKARRQLTPEQRRVIASAGGKAALKVPPEERSRRAKMRWERRTPEQRAAHAERASRSALVGWAKRREREREPGSSVP